MVKWLFLSPQPPAWAVLTVRWSSTLCSAQLNASINNTHVTQVTTVCIDMSMNASKYHVNTLFFYKVITGNLCHVNTMSMVYIKYYAITKIKLFVKVLYAII